MAEKYSEPAFPQADERRPSHEGMSLRDWFAGQALVALIGNGHDKPSAVEYAYSTADAMLAERSKPSTPTPMEAVKP